MSPINRPPRAGLKAIASQNGGVTSTSPPAPVAPLPLPFWARIETLWFLFVPLCALVYALLQPLAPNDLWYHVRAGEMLFQGGRVPTTNAMSSGVPLDAPFFYQSWLAEGGLFQTLSRWGLSGLQWLRALCLTGAFGVLMGATWAWAKREGIALGAASRAGCAGALWAFLLASNNVDLRPQMFSVLLCAAWVALLLAFWRAPSLPLGAGLCAVAALWANTHGAFILAPASLLALGAARVWEDRVTLKPYAVTLVAVVTATLMNPHGWALYAYLARLSNDPISQKYIQEWRSPGFDEWHSILFWLSPLLLTALWRAAKAPRAWWAWLAPLGLTFVMGARDQRAMIWFALFGAPLASLLLARLVPVSKPQVVPRAAQLINGALLVLLCAAPLAFAPAWKTSIPWPAAFTSRFAPTPQGAFPGDPGLLLERTTPVRAVEWWRAHPDAALGRVWTDMVCGSYLTWATRPANGRAPVVIPLCDPRIELFPAPFWEDYRSLSDGPRGAGDELTRRGFGQALLDVETGAPLVRELKRTGWQVAARGGSTVLLLAPKP